jgi:signal transduction histidine kinase/ActR/RegA family two-component response regulator
LATKVEGSAGDADGRLIVDEGAVAELILDASLRVVGVEVRGRWPPGCWDEAHGRPFTALLVERDRDAAAHLEEGVRYRRLSLELAAPSGDLPIVAEISRVGDYAMVTITPRQADADEISAEKMAEHRLEEIGVLVSGIAHDFNNVLSAILGNAELLGEELVDLTDDRELLDAAADIRTAADRSRELIAQMLGYGAKAQRGARGRVDLTAMTQEMARLLRVSTPQDILFTYSLDADVPLVEGDASQLRQVVMNLIVNAADAIGDDVGTVTMRSGTMYADRAVIDAGLSGPGAVEGDYVFVEVEDTGCGIDAPTLARIFDPFFTTKKTGRGLGLAGVRAIVAEHGGVLLVSSTPGLGTVFRVLLPVSEHRRDAKGAEASASATDIAGVRVLVVDDEAIIRRVVARILSSRGADVVCAADGHEALEILSEDTATIQCVVLNVSMPFISGIDVAAEINVTRPELPVLLISGYSATDIERRSAELSIAGIIQKPFSAAGILAAVVAALPED